MGLEGGVEGGQAAPGRAGHRVLCLAYVEAVVEGGLVDRVGELVGRQDLGEVDERSRRGGDRDALVDGHIASAEVVDAMDPESLAAAAVARHEDVDALPAPAPHLPVDRR